MAPVPKDLYEADMALLDRYQAFSSEIAKLSLAAVAAITTFLVFQRSPNLATGLPLISLVLFGCAAGAAILHRYVSTDAMACLISSIRYAEKKEKLDAEKAMLRRRLKQSGWLLLGASLSAAFAALIFVVGIVIN